MTCTGQSHCFYTSVYSKCTIRRAIRTACFVYIVMYRTVLRTYTVGYMRSDLWRLSRPTLSPVPVPLYNGIRMHAFTLLRKAKHSRRKAARHAPALS